MVSRCLRRLADESRDRERAERVWQMIADNVMLEGTTVASFVDGTLTLIAKDDALRSELRRTRSKWLRLMQKRIGGLHHLQVEMQGTQQEQDDFGKRGIERKNANGSSYE